MPTAPPRPCPRPGCYELIQRGERYCARHLAEYEQRERERRARSDAQRPSANARGYGSPWAKARRGFLAKHPHCIGCGASATVVDHITPHRGDRELFWDRANWQPLCATCHGRKTAAQDGGYGNRQGRGG